MCVPFISMFHLFFLLLCIIIILFYNVFLVVIMLYGAKKVNHVAMLSSWPLFISTTKRKKEVSSFIKEKKKRLCHILFIGKLYTKRIITYYIINNVLKIQFWYLKTMRQYICIKWNKMIFHKSYITKITKERVYIFNEFPYNFVV